ncbi:MAG: GntR family transcriptional regulator [Clostridiales bacterium]|nr:GntR family transcriptional regulator [Clostridiales bacterium]
MKLDFESDKPIFLQIAEEIEEAIFVGAFPEETQIPSTTEISTTFKINPATVLKGMNRLIDAEIIYKRRGVGMFVCSGAVAKITEKRKSDFYTKYIESMIVEANKLGLSKNELFKFIEKGMEEACHE